MCIYTYIYIYISIMIIIRSMKETPSQISTLVPNHGPYAA